MKSEHSSKKSQVISFIPDGEYYFQKGITAYQKGELNRARKFVGRAIAFNPTDSEYLCQQAAILAELEEFEASNQLLKKVVYELDETMTECFFFIANNLAHIGRYEEALQEVKRYISYEPKGGFIEEARELYKLLLTESEDPFFEEESYIVDHEKGRQALERGEFWEAIAYFKKVIANQPSYWAAYNNLAVAYYSLGRTKLAFEVLEEVLDHDPGNIHALCNRLTFYYQMGQSDRVNTLYPTIKNIYPLYPEHRSKLGATFFFLGDYEMAYYWLKSAESAGAWDQSFYYWLALSAFRLGKEKVALKAWEQVDFFSDSSFQPFEYGKIRDMLEAEDAKDNPLVHSLLTQQLNEGEPEPKVFSLFLLSHFNTEKSLHLLKSVSRNRKEHHGIRKVASALIEKVQQGEASRDYGLLIMTILEEKMGTGLPLIDQYGLYYLWKQVYERDVDITDVHEATIWAAGLEYLWIKRQSKPVSQSEIATKYGLSLYRVRKVLVQLQRILD
ncbi:tetratricopeptide (TPR) repeat protein [Pullulanibacillus pueri]|uniref:TPR repeat-containing protein YvcD n=1 Tax=Pullulanibacillus pueri TaxID=1437324 RepID=A0A8J2ZU24_9BACL|nr:tetratricopeptide repeat protein [Pullulanibacillus pueri]MBM7680230.1 tetratricopeptide (TPR) repeat protein [Pullulanibacillus pueri]GGH76092.1 TPR repeat-containing protein YvcD [Pullulanibacillus pueri]